MKTLLLFLKVLAVCLLGATAISLPLNGMQASIQWFGGGGWGLIIFVAIISTNSFTSATSKIK